MARILITANAKNRAKVFIPIAEKLIEMGCKVTFVSLDPILCGDATSVLKTESYPYLEFPYDGEKSLFEMDRSERFSALKKLIPSVKEILKSTNPDIILLGAASYVEDIFIEQAKEIGIKTVLMQDGLRIEQHKNTAQQINSWVLEKFCMLVNEWSRATYGVSYFFSPFQTNRVDKILLFGNGEIEQFAGQGVMREKMVAVGNPLYDSFTPLAKDRTGKIQEFLGIPPNKPVILFGMQCFNKHNVLTLESELNLAENLTGLFKNIPEVDLIFKLHPDNDHDIYKDNFNKWDCPENVHLVKDEFTPRELLGLASAFATVYSTMALEALVHEVPIITLDYTDVNYYLDLQPAAFSAKSEESLMNLLKQENWVGELTQNLQKYRDEILDRELVNLGFASEKAAEEIHKLI